MGFSACPTIDRKVTPWIDLVVEQESANVAAGSPEERTPGTRRPIGPQELGLLVWNDLKLPDDHIVILRCIHREP